MVNNSTKTVEQKCLLKNATKTVLYLLDALIGEDFESAKIELDELKCVIKFLEDIKIKRERQEALIKLVIGMKNRGINIDFAKNTLFFEKTANKVVETNINQSKNTKKRQQA